MAGNATVDRLVQERVGPRTSPPSPQGGRVVLMVTFHVRPSHHYMWHGTWKDIARLAAAEPACAGCRLLADSRNPTRRVMISEWDSHSALARFWRSAAAHLLEDALGYAHGPSEIHICEPLTDEPIDLS
jgi:quinol monooxygenase YgiN